MSHEIESEAAAAAVPVGDPDAAWTVACIQEDFVDWRKGRHCYAVWAISLDTPGLRAASVRMRRHLEAFLLPAYDRQAHITLRICGFLGTGNGLDDDYTPAIFRSQLASLQSALIRPFSVEIGAPETFTTAAYFSIRDGVDEILRLRHALGGDGPGERDFRYVPHATFGVYGGRFPVADVVQRMQLYPAEATIRLDIRQVTLLTYEASVINGLLTPACEFDLVHRTLRVLDAGIMDMLLK